MKAEEKNWYVYRFMIDDRLYFVVHESTLLPVPPGRCFVGWLRSDGEEFGGHFRVWQRWLPSSTSRTLYQVQVRT